MTYTENKFACDKCKKKLKTCNNDCVIVTDIGPSGSRFWAILKISIDHVSGFNNDADHRKAELCKTCAIEMLKDAIKRIKAGERITKGEQESEQQGWD